MNLQDGRLEDVWLDTLFPLLSYNDILRLRRVCKYINKLATAYLWTEGNQGHWELEINPLLPGHSLEEFLAIEPPPFSRLKINYRYTTDIDDQRSLLETEAFFDLLEKYGNFVTHLWICIEIPFAHKKELEFYESLKNLQHLHCYNVTFKSNTEIDDNFLIPLTFKNIKTLKVEETNNVAQMWRFIDRISSKFEYLKHPFTESTYDFDDFSELEENSDDEEENTLPLVYFQGLQRIIERRSNFIDSSKLLFLDWEYGLGPFANKLDFLRAWSTCFENGIRIKSLRAELLEYLLCDETGRINKDEIIDPVTNELIWSVNYTRNLSVGNIIQSLIQLRENVFLMELPNLEELLIKSTSYCKFRLWQCHGYPEWPSLKTLKIYFDGEIRETDDNALINFLFDRNPRANLEDILLDYSGRHNHAEEIPLPINLTKLCFSLKKLTISHCVESDKFFVSLWEGLSLLEYVSIGNCYNLGDQAFIGKDSDERTPVFLKLKKLRTVCVVGFHHMPKITDEIFITVFRHMRLSALTLSSRNILLSNVKVTVKGIQALINGIFAETVEKLDLENLILPGVSEEEIKRLTSLFRSSKMI